jgi:hypothetical protein
MNTSDKAPPLPRITTRQRKILAACMSGVKLEMQFAASGGGLYGDVQKLRSLGLLKRVPHPSVKDAMKEPADGIEITDLGRKALEHAEPVVTRASYRRAVEFIALNDSAADGPNEKDIAEYPTTALVADVFGKSCEEVAAAVARFRKENDV